MSARRHAGSELTRAGPLAPLFPPVLPAAPEVLLLHKRKGPYRVKRVPRIDMSRTTWRTSRPSLRKSWVFPSLLRCAAHTRRGWKSQGQACTSLIMPDWDSARLITDAPRGERADSFFGRRTASDLWSIALYAFMRDIYGYKKTALSCARYTPSSRRLPRIRGELSALAGLIKVSWIMRAALSVRPRRT